jgi:hypothetical protein
MENANPVNTLLVHTLRLDNLSNDTEADQVSKMPKDTEDAEDAEDAERCRKMPKILRTPKMLKMPIRIKHSTSHSSGVSCTPLKELGPVTSYTQVAHFADTCFKPYKTHITAAKRLLRYLKHTADAKLVFPGPGGSSEGLVDYTDADWCQIWTSGTLEAEESGAGGCEKHQRRTGGTGG